MNNYGLIFLKQIRALIQSGGIIGRNKNLSSKIVSLYPFCKTTTDEIIESLTSRPHFY